MKYIAIALILVLLGYRTQSDTLCYIGTRITENGAVTDDDYYVSVCPKPEMCYTITATYEKDETTAYGAVEQETTGNYTATNSTASNSTAGNDTATNGTAITGRAVNDTAVNGTSVNSTGVNSPVGNVTLVSVIAEYGGCFDNSSVSGLCYWFTSNINITEYSPACNVSASCNTSMCNEFVPMPECSSDPPENDMQIAPNCTMREVYNKVIRCMRPLLAGYPYSERTTCEASLDVALVCGVDLLNTCLSGPCPHILDVIPIQLRPVYAEILTQSKSYTSMSSFFESLGAPSNESSQIIGAMCLESGNQLLQDMQNLTSPFVDLNMTNPICDAPVLDNLLNMGFEAVQEVANARSHSEFCRPLRKIYGEMLKAWSGNCNKSAIIANLITLIPPPHDSLIPDVSRALDIVEELAVMSKLPGCEDWPVTLPANSSLEFNDAADFGAGDSPGSQGKIEITWQQVLLGCLSSVVYTNFKW